MAKTAIMAGTSFIAGSVLIATAFVGGSIIAVAAAVFFIGVTVAIGLDYIDEKYKISKKIIEHLKQQWPRKPRTPEANFQYILNTWGQLR